MSGNKIGGKAAAKTNKEKYGNDYYKKIGAKGGLKKNRNNKPDSDDGMDNASDRMVPTKSI